jgi:hypothetical protein
MRTAIVLLSICAIGYAADHWQDLSGRHITDAPPKHQITIYGAKSSGPFVQLQYQLMRDDVVFQKRDVTEPASARELTEKMARIGHVNTNYRYPVADVDGVMLEGATEHDIVRRAR